MNRKPIGRWGKRFPILALAVVASSWAVACESSDAIGPEGSARVQVLLTDAPADMLDTAYVWISRIYMVGGATEEPDTAEADTLDSGGDKVDLYNDPANPLMYDLLELRDGLTADLTGEVNVDVRAYNSLRFVIDSTRVTLADGYTFEDGTVVGTMKVPSGQTSGVKVKLRDVLEPAEDETLVLTVDWDVDANFQIQTSPQTGEVRKIMFKPTLKELGRGKS